MGFGSKHNSVSFELAHGRYIRNKKGNTRLVSCLFSFVFSISSFSPSIFFKVHNSAK